MKKLPKDFKFVGPEVYDYQLETIKFCVPKANAGILLDLGLGKTRCAIDVSRYRIQYNNVKKVLVVCPASLLENWKNEIERFSEYKAIILNTGRKGDRKRRALSCGCNYYIINYESLFPLIRDFRKVALKTLNFGMIIFDESARYLKNNISNRTKSAILLSDCVEYKLILTGTLIGNKPLDLWAQFRVLDGGLSFGRNFYVFRNEFFKIIDFGNFKKYELLKKWVPFFQRKIYNRCIRFTKGECLNLPSEIYQTIEIPLEGELKKIYKDVERKILSEIKTIKGTTSLKITSILTKLLRLQQITSGFVSEGRGKEVKLVDTPKLDALIEEIDTIMNYEESVIVWCRFRYSIDMIVEKLKQKDIKYLVMDGRVTSKKEKYRIWKGFQESKNINVFIGQIESGGFGIELFKKDSDPKKKQNMVIYENLWAPDIREQAMGRIHRIGQRSICRYVDIVVKNTIDMRILDTIKKKKRIVDVIMKRGVENFLK